MSQDRNEYYKNEIVHSLAEAIKRGGRSLGSVPGLLAKCISEDLWVERDVNGRIVRYDKTDFKRFVESEYPDGLSTTIETVKALCSDEPEILDFLAQANRGKVGAPIGNTNAKKKVDARGNVGTKHGITMSSNTWENDASYALNRLREDRPDLHHKVIAKELSPNAAMIKAGFRKNRMAVNLDNPESARDTLIKHMDKSKLNDLIDLLIAWQEEQLE